MKKRRRPVEKPPPRAAPLRPPAGGLRWWHCLWGLAAALVILLEVYQPALRGPFVFDDPYLPFTDPDALERPLKHWIGGVRPLLMASFWLNARLSGMEPYTYHLFNVLLHWVSGFLVFLVVRRLLVYAGTEGASREILAVFAAGVFLLHPVQTESVAYVASRSEALSVMFFSGALALYLWRRREVVSWPVAAGVLLLFGAAVTTKEHTAVLPALLLLTDLFFGGGVAGVRRNWRLYVPVAVGGALALRFVWRVLGHADTAGFKLAEVTWYEYFFTQCRMLWRYLRLFVLPIGQTIDYDVPWSRSLLEHGAVFGLAGLLALAVAAFLLRRRYPLASYGVFAFLLLMAPTSSVAPIVDPIAERRMYLPLLGLPLVAVEFLRRWRIRPVALAAALGGILVLAGALAQQRNRVWGSDVALWEDAVAHAPGKYRPRSQLAFAYFKAGRCAEAERHYEIASRLAAPDYRLYYNWGLAHTCLGRTQDARRQYLAALEDCRRQLERDPNNQAARQIVRLVEERLGLR